MPTIDDANKRLSELTAQISTLVRTVALGVLAVAWLFLSRSAEVSPLLNLTPEWEFICIALLSIVAVSFDLLQYVVGYKAVAIARDLAIKNKERDVTYPNNCYRRLRFLFFWAKFWVVIVAACWLIIALAFPIVDHLSK